MARETPFNYINQFNINHSIFCCFGSCLIIFHTSLDWAFTLISLILIFLQYVVRFTFWCSDSFFLSCVFKKKLFFFIIIISYPRFIQWAFSSHPCNSSFIRNHILIISHSTAFYPVYTTYTYVCCMMMMLLLLLYSFDWLQIKRNKTRRYECEKKKAKKKIKKIERKKFLFQIVWKLSQI